MTYVLPAERGAMIPALLTRFVRPFALGPGRVAATAAHPHGHVGSGGFPSCYVVLVESQSD